MLKKPTTTTTRDITATLTAAVGEKMPGLIAPWKPYKEIKTAAYQAKIADWQGKSAATATAPATGKETPKDQKEPVETDFGIEDARVRRHLDKLGLNAAITAAVKKIKEDHKPAAADGAQAPKIVLSEDEEIRRDAILNERIRIGNNVPEYLREFCEEIVNDVIHAAINAALFAERKIVLDSHIFENDCAFVQSACFKNLFMNLPTFVEARAKFSARANQILAAETTDTYLSEFSRYISESGQEKFKAIRDNLRKFVSAKDGLVKDDDGAAAAPSAAAVVDKKDARFTFYIHRMLKVIRGSNPLFADLRFSKNMTPFIDNLIVDFIQLVSMRAIIHITSTSAETVSKPIIHAIILGMMASPSALLERQITSIAKERVMVSVVKKSADGTRPTKTTVPDDVMVATIAQPAFILLVDSLYPLGARVPHQRAPKAEVADAVAPEAAAPAAPKAESKPEPKTEAPKVEAKVATAKVAAEKPIIARKPRGG